MQIEDKNSERFASNPPLPLILPFHTGDTAVVFYSHLIPCATAHTVLSLDFTLCSLTSV